MIRELATIAENLKEGRAVDPVTVRTFLGWFGAKRRGFVVTHRIRWQLQEAGLATIPDFESSWLDSYIEFQQIDHGEASVAREAAPVEDESIGSEPTTLSAEPVTIWVSKDPSYRISKLAAANSGVTSINRNASLSQAATVMMTRDFSQLPVMTGERDVQGIISWKSI
jgi:hypothetical protein